MYPGRPGVSPVLSTLLAAGAVRKGDRILDVGCGTGAEAALLGRWGFRRVAGIDTDPAAVAAARRRAARLGLAGRVAFEVAAPEDLAARRPPPRFDVLLHTLVANNLPRRKDAHFAALAALLRPGGLLVLQERVVKGLENAAPGAVAPLGALRRHFRLTRGHTTHLPEPGRPGHARVVLWLGRPRA